MSRSSHKSKRVATRRQKTQTSRQTQNSKQTQNRRRDEQKRSQKRPLKPAVRFSLLAFFLLATLALGFMALTTPRTELVKKDIVQYAYTLTVEASPRAKLLPNDLYEEEWLGADSFLAIRLLDTLYIDYTAEFSGTSSAKFNGDYEVTAKAKGVQVATDNRNVFERDYTLLPNQTFSNEGRSVAIEESVPLDMTAYREFVDHADAALGTKTTKDVQIVFQGSLEVETAYGVVHEPFSLEVSLPLTVELITLPTVTPINLSKTLTTTEEILVSSSAFLLPVAAALVAFVLFLCLLLFTKRPDAIETYHMNLKDIQRKHGSRMIRLLALSSKSELERGVQVSDIESLIRVADELQRPICYVLDENRRPVDGLFFIHAPESYYLLSLSPPEAPVKPVESDVPETQAESSLEEDYQRLVSQPSELPPKE